KEVVDKGISVRALEKMVLETREMEELGKEAKKQLKNPQIKKMEEELIAKLGTKVEIKHSGNKGRIEISYYSLDDFERIIEKIK
ncbi:MAG TPA: chromosome partitioning protein ParB, partial [Spirochaetota bacterium]|nr:chromosome partitioning protein ParB [Spirochaetota bacterium]